MGMARYKATDRQRAIAADTFILFYFTSLFFRASTEGRKSEVKGGGEQSRQSPPPPLVLVLEI